MNITAPRLLVQGDSYPSCPLMNHRAFLFPTAVACRTSYERRYWEGRANLAMVAECGGCAHSIQESVFRNDIGLSDDHPSIYG